MEFLHRASIDIGYSAGVAALISLASGNPIEIVYISATTEWTALLTAPGSDLHSLEDLRGRSMAATPGTDPHVFMLRSLSRAGLTLADVSVVTLQHADGKSELMRGRVDAWAASIRSWPRPSWRGRPISTATQPQYLQCHQRAPGLRPGLP